MTTQNASHPLNLTQMFLEFNNLYSVGTIEPTKENLIKIKGLIDDEVKELHQEAFERDFLSPGEVYKEIPINEKSAAFEIIDIIYITLERLTALDKMGNWPSYLLKSMIDIDESGDLILSFERYEDDHLELNHDMISDLVEMANRKTFNIGEPGSVQESIESMQVLVSLMFLSLDNLGLNAIELLKAKHASNMSKALSAHNPDLVIKELNHAKNRYPAADAELHGDLYILRCQDSKKVIKPRTYKPAEIDNKKMRL